MPMPAMAVLANSTQVRNIVCCKLTMITTTGIWEGKDPLKSSLTRFVFQFAVIVVTSRLLTFLLRPLRQPCVVAEIIVRTLYLQCMHVSLSSSLSYLCELFLGNLL